MQSNSKAIIAAIAGNAIEWYDFTVFALMTPVIKSLFFPADDAAGGQTNALLLTTALFGCGFLMRPLGGLVLGYLGDRCGRKSAMTLGMALMALGMAMLAVAPTYASAGVAAPIIVLLARLLQGFSVGGEFGSSTAYLIEAAPKDHTGFYGSWQIAGQLMANVLGTLLGAALTFVFTAEQLSAGAWRIPFFVGLAIIPVLLYLRARLVEPEAFRSERAKAGRKEFRAALKQSGRSTLIGLGLVIASTVSVYISFGYTALYAQDVLGLPLAQSFLVQTLTAIMMMVLVPVAGAVADRYARKPLVITSLTLYLLSLYPLYAWVVAAPTVGKLLLCQLSIGFFSACFLGIACTTLAELFPIRIRATSLSIVTNIAVLTFGGFAPFVVTWLMAVTNSPLAPIFYVMLGVGIGLISALFLPKPERGIFAAQQ